MHNRFHWWPASIEEKDLDTRAVGEGFYNNIASESILHLYVYNVNQKENLSRD